MPDYGPFETEDQVRAAVVMGPRRESWCWLPEQRDDWVKWADGKDVTANPPEEGITP